MKPIRLMLLFTLLAPVAVFLPGCSGKPKEIEITEEGKSLYDTAGERVETMQNAAMKEDAK
ncbi:hypothetical protein CA13_59330 [Planctomycetes bacterium CA13]|uniref:Uncharacterized protein n=1 Tax=Novipirellula herctigrandis TaxID=2527986 RepID=A0A5C5ZBB8_9BACT|nr:hypothetical protein CA13_59330 [Planctomycetes bacterium CA13]